MTIPLLKTQMSSRGLMLGRFGHKLTKPVKEDEPILIDMLNTPDVQHETLKQTIYNRSLDPTAPAR